MSATRDMATKDRADFGDAIADHTPVAIIGAGPAGTCCAGKLLELGIAPMLLERAQFPRFAIGESFLPRTLYGLDSAGLLDAVDAEDFNHKPGALFCDGTSKARIDFDIVSKSPFKHAFHARRSRFDACLARAVSQKGATVCFGASVVGAVYEDDGWTLTVTRDDTEYEVHARFVVDASGGARVIPRLRGQSVTGTGGSRSSVFAHLEDPRRPDGFDGNAVWILSNETDTWGWVIPFSDGVASVGFVGEHVGETDGSDRERFESLFGAYPALTERFAQPFYERAPVVIEAYEIEQNDLVGPGYCLVGNSVGFIDPVFSSGVTVATETAIRAAEGIARGLDGDGFDWESDYAQPVAAGYEVFVQCVDSWYSGELRDLIYSDRGSTKIREYITAILAGRVWDESNPITTNTRRKLRFFWRRLKEAESAD